MDFTTHDQVTITGLGLYSGNFGAFTAANPGVSFTGAAFSGDDFVTLFKSDGTVLAQVEFGNSTGDGTNVAGTSDFIKPLATPLVLPDGFTGSITARYGNGTDQLNNAGGAGGAAPSETGSSSLTYTGSGRNSGSTNPSDYPTNLDGGPANRYNGPTFSFTVPEPASIALLALGGLPLLSRRRRR